MDFAVVVKLLLCLALLFTYPVMLFPVVKLVEANVEERVLLLLRSVGLIENLQVIWNVRLIDSFIKRLTNVLTD